MMEENRPTVFRIPVSAAVIFTFSFLIYRFEIQLMFKTMRRLFRVAFSHATTMHLSYIKDLSL